jgi:ParB-like chromosome segregation protein Spo0J
MSGTVGGYPVHPACALLPMMTQASLREMADDIAAHGQQQPVILYDGQLLDGRNRLMACEIAGVEPVIQEFTGDDPLRWVLSLNFHRRHLTDSQKSIVGARAEELLAERKAAAQAAPEPVLEEEETPPEPPKPASDREIRRQARETAAALVNVSPSAIARGRKLIDNAVPELVGAVARGTVTLTQASRVAKLDAESQRDLVARGDEAIVEEAVRIQQSHAAARPSLTRALNELDVYCARIEISKVAANQWAISGQLHHAPDDPFEHDGESLKEAVLNAWAQASASADALGASA